MLPFICIAQANAQDYAYAHYDVKEGLASSVVYSAVQDKDGFMWFGTEAGLSRFDGTNFKNFTIEDGLPDNEILKLFVDSRNRLWIIPFKNAVCYYYKGEIYTSKNDPVLALVKINSIITSIGEDNQGNILLLEDQMAHLILSDSTVKTITNIDGTHFYGLTVGLDKSGDFQVAIATKAEGLIFAKFDKSGAKVVKTVGSEYNDVNSVILSDNVQIYRDQEKITLIEDDKIKVYPQPQGMRSVSLLSDSILCVNSPQGSYVYNVGLNNPPRILLENETVNAVFSDDSQNWWFCTARGVFRLLSTASRRFPFEVNGRPSSIYCIGKGDSSIYFGSDNFRLIKLQGDKFDIEKITAALSPGRITSILDIPPNHFVIGTDFGIYFLKPFKKITIVGVAVKTIIHRNDTLLVSYHIGVRQLRLTDGKWVDTPWNSRSTCSWYEGSKIYIGTLNGLYVIDENGKQIFLGDQFPQLTGKISALAEDRNKTIWVATYGFGLVGIRNDSAKFFISTKSGLSSNTCRTLFIDSNTIWVGTDKGLDKIQFTASGPQILRFTSADGLPDAVINCIYVDGTTVYTGSAEGMTRFDELLITKQSNCRLRITGVQIGLESKYYDTSDFVLPHNYTQLRFDYSAISFKSAGDITYYYRLTGLNNTWETTRSGFLNYPSLPSGEYVLQLYAVNKFGVKSNTLAIPFSVKKLFWETLWFQALAFLLVLSAIWIFIVLRIRWLKRKERAEIQLKKRMMEMEQMALKAQMNPHFIFNCLNSIQQYVMEKDFAAVNKFITDFASLIRKTLEASSKTEISLEEELGYISTYLRLEQARLEDKFTFQIHVPDEIVPSDYYLPPMLLQPCLENSIRHGIRYRPDNLGKIDVHIKKNATYLFCIIEDNGVGRKQAQEYKSLSHIEYQSKGMQLTASRIEMLSLTAESKASIAWEDVVDQNGEVAGTRVTLGFPLDIITKG